MKIVCMDYPRMSKIYLLSGLYAFQNLLYNSAACSYQQYKDSHEALEYTCLLIDTLTASGDLFVRIDPDPRLESVMVGVKSMLPLLAPQVDGLFTPEEWEQEMIKCKRLGWYLCSMRVLPWDAKVGLDYRKEPDLSYLG